MVKGMHRLSAEPGDRLKSALGVAAIHALIGYALLRGLGVPIAPALRDAQQLISVTHEPPPPHVPAPPDTERQAVARPKDPEGAASPANRKDTPTEVVAPVPEIVVPPPPSIAAAAVAGQGSAAAAGAAVVPGPGTGAGGIGTGLGSGLYGNGTGGGGGGRGVSARYLRGGINPRDYPRRAVERRAQGTTYLRFTILPNGRVRNCVVTRSSGHRDLDAATCPLLERSLRYRPARDASGRPVAETIRGQQDWQLGPEPPVREYEGEVIEEVREVPRRRF
jgi:protein TonB